MKGIRNDDFRIWVRFVFSWQWCPELGLFGKNTLKLRLKVPPEMGLIWVCFSKQPLIFD
jgi:hypothetical protein